MRAVLLFSALLHIVAIGALAAFALQSWLRQNRASEPSTLEFVSAAAALGVLIAVVGSIIAWMGRPFGPAVTTGLAAGLLSALAFMLTLGVTPHTRNPGPASLYVRVSALSLVGALILTEVVAFCFLVVSASHTAPYS